MIVRLWSARTSEVQSLRYVEHFSSSVLPKLRGSSGYAGASVLIRQANDEVEILVATGWKSHEAIREFAGEDFEAAVVADEAAALLSEFDRRVRHYELVIMEPESR
jgi:heme-degrading monooxygenase HmoA